MDACADAWAHVASFLLPIDIVSLSNARKRMRAHLRQALARVIRARLTALLPPSLKRDIWPPGVQLSGSACWYAIAGDGSWKPNDRDLFCTFEQRHAAQLWLEASGFFLQSGGMMDRTSTYAKNVHAVAEFYSWPDAIPRAPVDEARVESFRRMGLLTEGREWPLGDEWMSGRRPAFQLVIMRSNAALDFDLDILLNTYDGKTFEVQRPDLVAARTCTMRMPHVCSRTRGRFQTQEMNSRERAEDRLEKYLGRGIVIVPQEEPCPNGRCISFAGITIQRKRLREN